MVDDRHDALVEEETGLDELAAPAPDENPDGENVYRHRSLESARRQPDSEGVEQEKDEAGTASNRLTQLYVVSYLIFFSILGVLARIGLQALTVYPDALIANTDLWANFGGCLVIGLLREDRMLFRRHWRRELENAQHASNSSSDNTSRETGPARVKDTAKAALATVKGGIPAYIGLTVGFCGSFTSFASVCRDSFLAMSNSLNTAVDPTGMTSSLRSSRPAGDSVMAVLAVLILEVGLSTTGLQVGAHLATALARPAEKLPTWSLSGMMDPLVVLLGPGCWLGAVLLTVWPGHDAWRGQVLFALVFAPVGCILRFLLSVRMNKLIRSFPLGTFTANVCGTCILGLAYDVQMTSGGGAIISCQVMQGIMDGFCGALTTVSTWVLEMDTLRLKHAYFYGLCSLFFGVGFITAIMGSVRWTIGFTGATCTT